MIKKLSILLVLCLIGCQQQKHDTHYYASHPQALKEALRFCPERTSAQVSCQALVDVASKMQSLGEMLQVDQLAYGRKILALQEQVDDYRRQLKVSPDARVKHALNEAERSIKDRLVVLDWLTSPRRRA